jgi:hypothetical protein
MTVHREGDHLATKLSNQSWAEYFPDSKTEFFAKSIKATKTLRALMPSASKPLKCAALTFDHDGRRLVHGRLTAGAVQVTAPGVPTKAARIHPQGFCSSY